MAAHQFSGKRARRCLVALTLALGVPSALVIPATAAHAAVTPAITVSPAPGSAYANPHTTISLRGVDAAQIGTIVVTGSATGRHTGAWIAHSDGNGASFTPAQPFAPGEHVTVSTDLGVRGGNGGSLSFTIARPSSVAAAPNSEEDGELAPQPQPQLQPHAEAPGTTQSFVTRPDLRPPLFDVSKTGPTAPGLIAVTPRATLIQGGPLLVDDSGQVVWDDPISDPGLIDDLKVVHYNGHDDLAWWQGTVIDQGHGSGTYQLVDNHYQPVTTIAMGNGFAADLHDMIITPQNTAIVEAYAPVTMDTTAEGGVANGTVLDIVVQEVDIATGAVLWEWHSLDHIPLSKSLLAAPNTAASAYDYLHANAVELANNGDLLLSGRHASQVYDINRTTGAIVWTLGRGGDFTPTFADAQWFAFQHDVRVRSDGSISVFDNGAGPAGLQNFVHTYSRGLVMTLDLAKKQVSIAKEVRLPGPPDLLAASQGDFRELANGDDFIGWGAVGEATEFNAAGTPVLDLQFPTNAQSYRAVKQVWHATPAAPPDVVVHRNGASVSAIVSWNGATDVARWRLRAGNDPASLHAIWSSARTGFETTVTTQTTAPIVEMQAIDANGKVLGTSALVSTSGSVDHSGYWLADRNGGLHPFATAASTLSIASIPNRHLAGVAAAPGGEWIVMNDGALAAPPGENYGSPANLPLHAPIVGIAPTPDGRGYWLAAADGGVFAYGDARFRGSMGGQPLAKPVVGIAAAPNGQGYWLVASDGGVFAFGDAHFRGSAGGTRLNRPVVGIAAGSDNDSYFLGASDGGVFTYGNARFHGSAGGLKLAAPVVGIASTFDAKGYWLVASDGGVFTYGDARFHGSLAGSGVPVVAIAHD